MENIKIENYILEYDDLFEKEYCDWVIEYYKNMEKGGFTASRVHLEDSKKHIISDNNTALHGEGSISVLGTQNISNFFLQNFWEKVYKSYEEKYSILSSHDRMQVHAIKLQKSAIGEGYHIWHCENSNRGHSGRILTFIAYMNDVEEGGETEFLYYPKRVKAKTGKLILFPGAFTHTHRGNPPISNEKYILTGWVEI